MPIIDRPGRSAPEHVARSRNPALAEAAIYELPADGVIEDAPEGLVSPRSPGSGSTPAVEVDIKPGSDLNAINPFSRGVIPVAIRGSEAFDVPDVDVTTLGFGSNVGSGSSAALTTGCGLGFELAFLLPPLMWLFERRKRKRA